MRHNMHALSIAALLAAAGQASAQAGYLVADRTNDTIWRLIDADNSGVFDEPGEVINFFSSANAAGTLAIMNPTCMATAPNGACAIGDQGNRVIYVFRDNSGDGDANDAGESIVYADATNASGVSFAFPTGASFGPDGHLYIVNGGNSFGNDAVYRLVDLNNDGDAQDAGEIVPFAADGAFGPGNGPYSPQEIAWIGDVLYLRNSSAGLFGVFRLEDLNDDDDADDPGEFTPFFDATSTSGITPSSGFALAADPVRPGSLYTAQIASGGVDQIIRLTDLNSDDSANDADEAALVFENIASGFSVIDILALPDGRLLLTDTSTDTVVVLTDMNNDDDFLDAGESAIFFANTTPILADARQLDPIVSTALQGDANADGIVDFSDLNAALSAFGRNGLGLVGNVNGDAVVDFTDLNSILSNFGQSTP
jgi:hypothetical protein